MRWVTRERPKTDRIACPWLIRRFIDPDAEILYVPADQVLDVARDKDARSFDAPGADFTHRDGRCTFEVLVEDHGLTADPGLARLAQVVHAADIDGELDTDPLGPGLLAIGWAASTWRPMTTGSWSANRSSTTPSTPGAPSRPRDERHLRLRRAAGRHGAPGGQAHGRRGSDRPQVWRSAVPSGQAPVHRDRGDRRPRSTRPAGHVDAGPGRRAPRADLVPRRRGGRSGRRRGLRRPGRLVPTELRLRSLRLPPAPSSSTRRRSCAATPTSWNSPGRTATCATSTSGSPWARRPRPPPSTPSIAGARRASRWPLASWGSSGPTWPWPCRSR